MAHLSCNDTSGTLQPMLKKRPADPVTREKSADWPVDTITCPGGKHKCGDSETCCLMLSGQYGCCPVPNVSTVSQSVSFRLCVYLSSEHVFYLELIRSVWCLSFFLSVCPPSCLSVMSVLFICQCVSVSHCICLCVCLSVISGVCLCFFMSVCLYLSVMSVSVFSAVFWMYRNDSRISHTPTFRQKIG